MSQTASPAMQTGASSRRRDRTAIGSSIALHVCALALLVALPRSSLPTEEPDERILLSSIVRIQAAPRPHRATARPVRAADPRPAVTLPPLHVTAATERARRPLVVAAEHRYATPAPAPAEPRAQPPAAVPVVAAPSRPPAVIPTATPTATPAATRSPAAVAAATAVPTAADREVGMGNFGETYPARPVPGLVDALRAKVPHLVARITVDERGRATSVALLAGTEDQALRDEITRTLLAATYIPASCNGLSCSQTFELRT